MRQISRSSPDRSQNITELIPFVTIDQVADGPVGPYITLSPAGSDGMHSPCDPDQSVADGPVGPSVTLGPVGPWETLSQCNSDQPVADGPVGSSVELGLVGLRGMSLQIDINKIVTTDEAANSVGTSPSSDSGIHSLGEQWEDTIVVTTDAEEEQNRTSRIYTPTQRCVIDTCVPTDTEEDSVTPCPLIACLSKQMSDESPEIDILTNRRRVKNMNRRLMIYNTSWLCGIKWTRRECHTYVDKTRFNSVRTVVQCGQKPTAGTQISVI